MVDTVDIPGVVKQLESLGHAHEVGDPVPVLEERYVQTLRTNSRDIRQYLQALSERELRQVLKGFILFSRQYSPYGLAGSESPFPVFFKVYAKRFPEQEPELCAWVVDNRVNPYEPFGTQAHNHARSLKEHQALVEAAAAKSRQNMDREAERQEIAHARRLERERERAQKNLPGAIARGDQKAINELLVKSAKINPDQQDG